MPSALLEGDMADCFLMTDLLKESVCLLTGMVLEVFTPVDQVDVGLQDGFGHVATYNTGYDREDLVSIIDKLHASVAVDDISWKGERLFSAVDGLVYPDDQKNVI